MPSLDTFVLLLPLVLAVTTLPYLWRRKGGVWIFLVALAGAFVGVRVALNASLIQSTEDTGIGTILGMVLVEAPAYGFTGAWLGVGSTVAVARRNRTGALLGMLIGVALVPQFLLSWPSFVFEPEMGQGAVGWVMTGSVTLLMACGAVAGGVIDLLGAIRFAWWIATPVLLVVLAWDGFRSHAIRDHATPINELSRQGDVAALRIKADEYARSGSRKWQLMTTDLKGYPGAPRPAVAYAQAAPDAALQHASPEVRGAAVWVLAARGDRRVIPQLREMLPNREYGVGAAEMLARWGDVASIPAFTEAIASDHTYSDKSRLVQVLASLGESEGESAVVRLAHHPDRDTHLLALAYLARSPHPESRAFFVRYCFRLFRVLQESPSNHSARAANELCELKPDEWQTAVHEYHQRLMRDAASGDRRLRQRAITALNAESTSGAEMLRMQLEARSMPE